MAASTATTETTFLGAHVVPPDVNADEYVAQVTGPMLEACATHARWIDVFCDRGAFDVDQAREILRAGSAKGLMRINCRQVGVWHSVSSLVSLPVTIARI